MGNSKYLGSVFSYEEKGFDFNVEFKCEEVETEIGIKVAKVTEIKVLDKTGSDNSDFVDMEKVRTICENKAASILIKHIPPTDL